MAVRGDDESVALMLALGKVSRCLKTVHLTVEWYKDFL